MPRAHFKQSRSDIVKELISEMSLSHLMGPGKSSQHGRNLSTLQMREMLLWVINAKSIIRSMLASKDGGENANS